MLTFGTDTSFDLKSKFPNDYMNFTIDNFIICHSNASVDTSYEGNPGNNIYNNGSTSISSFYDMQNGILTITLKKGSVYANCTAASGNTFASNSATISSAPPKAYLLIGGIQ